MILSQDGGSIAQIHALIEQVDTDRVESVLFTMRDTPQEQRFRALQSRIWLACGALLAESELGPEMAGRALGGFNRIHQTSFATNEEIIADTLRVAEEYHALALEILGE